MGLNDAIPVGHVERWEDGGCFARGAHVFEQDAMDAVDAALAARRPLLVCGEPGTGKSQLAFAAARVLKRALVATAVDAQTETRDLLWTLDAVARLAEAQVARGGGRRRVAVRHFVQPGALWWAFDWETASVQARSAGEGGCVRVVPDGWTAADGTVVLIDEIDKADSSVPNGLLDALGHGRFGLPWGDSVSMTGVAPPLVLITSNGERTLPPAFLRRCFVLNLALPVEDDEHGTLTRRLTGYGRAHFPEAADALLSEAAAALLPHRKLVYDRGQNPPGVAEYLDLLRAVHEPPFDRGEPADRLRRVLPYLVNKHPKDSGL